MDTQSHTASHVVSKYVCKVGRDILWFPLDACLRIHCFVQWNTFLCRDADLMSSYSSICKLNVFSSLSDVSVLSDGR